jgi:WxcM-like protein
MRGVQLIELERNTDDRGALVAIGADSPIPFDVKHFFFILDCPTGAIRAEHAGSHHSALVALCDEVTVDVDNGDERDSIRLTRPDAALIIWPGVWIRLHGFSEQTRLAVLSSEAHADMQHFEEPVPALLDTSGSL